MGAPQVIPTPTKAYVAINSFSSDKSIQPTLCDLGRVSNIAAAVTLPRSSNFVNRNTSTQNNRSMCNRKRPISKVLGDSSSNTHRDNTKMPITSQPKGMVYHSNRSGTHGNQSSISASAVHSNKEANTDRIHDSISQAKYIKLESTDSRVLSSPESIKVNDQRNISISAPEKAQMAQRTSLSANLISQKTKTEPIRNPTNENNSQNMYQLPNQQAVMLLAPVIEKLPTQLSPSITMQLQQQNQQLRSENMILQKQLNLFKQLMKNPQRLNQVLTRLKQSVH